MFKKISWSLIHIFVILSIITVSNAMDYTRTYREAIATSTGVDKDMASLIILGFGLVIALLIYIGGRANTKHYCSSTDEVLKKQVNEKYGKIGGVLVFYSIMLALSIFTGFAELTVLKDNVYLVPYKIIAMIEGMSKIAIMIYIINLINKKDASNPKKIRKSLIIMTIITFLAKSINTMYMLFIYKRIDIDAFFTETITAILNSLAYLAIWWSYFKTSLRVKIYYGKEKTEEKSQGPIEEK